MKSIFKKSLYLIMVFCLLFLCVGLTAKVSAADTIVATFEFGENSSKQAHVDGNSTPTYTEESNGYTLELKSLTNVYSGAYDAKGNSCLKLGTSSKAGAFSFDVPTDVTSVVIKVAKYKAKNSIVTISGTETTLTKSSDNGEYDEITVDTTKTKTISFETASTSTPRCMINAIVFYSSGSTTEYVSAKFDSQGGTSVSTKSVEKGTTIEKPTDPNKAGYEFVGWFTEADEAFDFSTPITSDITLYAKWKEAVYLPLLSMETKASLYADYSTTITTLPNVKYEMVKDATSIKAGDKIVIASQSKGVLASEAISSNVLGTTNVSEVALPDILPGTTLVEGVFTIGGEDGKWTLANSEGKLLGVTKVKNVAYESGTTTWTISIAENGDATIASTNSSLGRILYNVNNPRFTTYTSDTSATMVLPQIYKVVEDTTSTIEVINYEITSLAMRFGMIIEKTLYDNIVASGEMKFGVCLYKGSSFKDAEAKLVECTPVRVNANGEEVANGEYYQFAAVITDIPEEDRTQLVTAKVCVYNSSDKTIVAYAQEKTMSVKTLAEAYGNLEGYEGILEYLRR